jgi:hypothetical protein
MKAEGYVKIQAHVSLFFMKAEGYVKIQAHVSLGSHESVSLHIPQLS